MSKLFVALAGVCALTALALTPAEGQAGWIYVRGAWLYEPDAYGPSYPYSETPHYRTFFTSAQPYYYGSYSAPVDFYRYGSYPRGYSYYEPYSYGSYSASSFSYYAPTPAAYTYSTPYTYGAYNSSDRLSSYYESRAPVMTSSAEIPQTVNVGIHDGKYEPKTITVSVGTTVSWVNEGAEDHTVTSDSNEFESGVTGPNSSYSHTFYRAGTYHYHCSKNPAQMRGEVVVK